MVASVLGVLFSSQPLPFWLPSLPLQLLLARSFLLTCTLLPPPDLAEAEALLSQEHDQSSPPSLASHRQNSWDSCKVMATSDALLEGAPDARSRARLLAAVSKESGAWLNALPISSFGLCLDDNTHRIAVGLRLGSSLCRPHTC